MKGLCLVHFPATSDRGRVYLFFGLEVIPKGSNGLHFLDYVLFMLDNFFELNDFDLIIIDLVGLKVIVKV